VGDNQVKDLGGKEELARPRENRGDTLLQVGLRGGRHKQLSKRLGPHLLVVDTHPSNAREVLSFETALHLVGGGSGGRQLGESGVDLAQHMLAAYTFDPVDAAMRSNRGGMLVRQWL